MLENRKIDRKMNWWELFINNLFIFVVYVLTVVGMLPEYFRNTSLLFVGFFSSTSKKFSIGNEV